MKQTRYKRINFDFKLARKITRKEIKGRVVTKDGQEAQIISFDRGYTYPIIALIGKEEKECFYCENGNYFECYKNPLDLHIELPNYHKDYSNFKPRKYQPCLVRNSENSLWGISVYAYTDYQGKILFYDGEGHLRQFANCLPLSKATKRLLGTTKSYEKLMQEINAKSTVITKNNDNGK